ncbi:unnamed protein product [Parnassius apollo]|uniref:(apollo) hypothetical protein n=1 Tax=Parnassius apollo TaxID=110799 RepID=A0A8S3XV98_PARAO|nr:unnamed protein product [Parnassius apollo]
MSHKILIAVLFTCFVLEVSTKPADVTTTDGSKEETLSKTDEIQDSEEKLLSNDSNQSNPITRDILEKIKTINDGLKKPDKFQKNYNNNLQSDAEYVIDAATFEKIQQIISSVKPRPSSQQINSNQETNSIFNENDVNQRFVHSKALSFIPSSLNNGLLPTFSMPYITTMPILMVPAITDVYTKNSIPNSIQSDSYQTRQESPSFPFQFQWPFASFFPILVKDPLLAFMHGGGWNNFFEFGQSADVCSVRKQKSSILNTIENMEFSNNVESNKFVENVLNTESLNPRSRIRRSLKKRNILTSSTTEQELTSANEPKKVILKPAVTRKTTNKPRIEKEKVVQDTKSGEIEGDLRFPFSDFSWFGNKKPVAPSPGFFINRLRVRKGGVAIAGPGGVATAGRGGTAIVGPGGLAYTQPGGIAVAGPAARVIALSPHTDLTSLISRLHPQSTDESVPRSFNPLLEGRLEIFYYRASTQYLPFYGGAKGQYLEVKKDTKGVVVSEKILAEDSISSDNIVKNTDDSLLSRVFAANLQSLRTLSSNVLKLHTLGRKTGSLGNTDKSRFKSQLSSLGETASNTIKLIDEIGDNVDALFNQNATLLKRNEENFEDDDVGDESVGVDSPFDTDEFGFSNSRIAEAKPFGLAVIGETGLAASRPMGTAVASSGVAIARPIGIAIAGIDPTRLGIDYQINQSNGDFYPQKSPGKN